MTGVKSSAWSGPEIFGFGSDLAMMFRVRVYTGMSNAECSGFFRVRVCLQFSCRVRVSKFGFTGFRVYSFSSKSPVLFLISHNILGSVNVAIIFMKLNSCFTQWKLRKCTLTHVHFWQNFRESNVFTLSELLNNWFHGKKIKNFIETISRFSTLC